MGFRVQGLEFRGQSPGFRVDDTRFSVGDSELTVQVSGVRGLGVLKGRVPCNRVSASRRVSLCSGQKRTAV